MASERELLPREIDEQAIKANEGRALLNAISYLNLPRLVVDGCLQTNERGYFRYEEREKHSVFNFLMTLFFESRFITKISSENLAAGKEEKKINFQRYHDIHARLYPFSDDFAEELRRAEKRDLETKDNHGMGVADLSLEGLVDLIQFKREYPGICPRLNPRLMADLRDPENPGARTYTISRLLIIGLLDALKIKIQARRENALALHYVVTADASASETAIEQIFNNYYSSEKQATNDDQVIFAIVNCIYDLEHLHAYGDGNLRTNIIVANIFLMNHGFPPVMYYDPNLLDGCSKLEFFECIKQGMLTTLEVIRRPYEAFYNFSTSSLSDAEIARINEEMKMGYFREFLETNKKLYLACDAYLLEKTKRRIEALRPNLAPIWILKDQNLSLDGIEAGKVRLSSLEASAPLSMASSRSSREGSPSSASSAAVFFPRYLAASALEEKEREREKTAMDKTYPQVHGHKKKGPEAGD